MRGKNISIKFCGGCNPSIDRGKLAAAVQEFLTAHRHNVFYNRTEADLVIFISGCSANCAWRYAETDSPHIVVAGTRIDGFAVPKEKLESELINKIKVTDLKNNTKN